jgi:hypothetical protein
MVDTVCVMVDEDDLCRRQEMWVGHNVDKRTKKKGVIGVQAGHVAVFVARVLFPGFSLSPNCSTVPAYLRKSQQRAAILLDTSPGTA